MYVSRIVFTLTWPLIIEYLAESILSITDLFFISGLGYEYIAVVGVCSNILWFLTMIILIFSLGTQIIVSQAFGARRLDIISHTVTYSCVLSLSFSIVTVLALQYLTKPLLSIITGNELLSNIGKDYLTIRIFELIFLSLSLIFSYTLKGMGNTRTPMIIALISISINIILDPVLIYGLFGLPRLGIVGAALASLSSIIIMSLIYIYILLRNEIPISRSFDKFKELAKKILNLGLPSGLERVLISLSYIIYISLIARCGVEALTAHQIGLSVESFIFMLCVAFSIASSVLVGQRVGSDDIVGARLVAMECAKLSVKFMAITGVLLVTISPLIPKVFTSNEYVIYLTMTYLILAGLSEPGLALIFTFAGAYRGAGSPTLSMILNVAGFWIYRIPLTVILIEIMSVLGAWIAMFIDVYLRGLTFYVVFNKYFESRIVRKRV
ncbi:MAG: hypothetical protein B6V02_01355 [Thermoprotei archaeon ex4572_64]|nr:MAG: hypothetical protein B6V02_01355 [Thermoprotei archaeon ex4572_64]